MLRFINFSLQVSVCGMSKVVMKAEAGIKEILAENVIFESEKKSKNLKETDM